MVMPESYYEKGLKLIIAERRAYRNLRKNPTDKRIADIWLRASRRLSKHEMSFNTK